MSTFDKESYYFSGQGVIMLATRTALGKPAGFVPVANVSALSIAVEEDVEEHKESQSGQRGIDKRISTETRATLTMTMESFVGKNLAIALRGDNTEKVAAALTNDTFLAYFNAVSPLSNIGVSSVVVEHPTGPTSLTLYTDESTAWDYKLNADAGSVMFNGPGTGQDFAALADNGQAITGISVAAQAVVSVANTSRFAVGGYMAIADVTGTMAATINNKFHKIVSIVANTSVTIAFASTGLTYTAGGTAEGDANGITTQADYSYVAQNLVGALTQGSSERYLRLEGINTADDNKSVVVEVFKFQTDPLSELALINESITGFELEGSVLADSLQLTGSKYFTVKLLR